MTISNTPKNDIENNIVEDFFKILISKELFHRDYFEVYYKTFLDND